MANTDSFEVMTRNSTFLRISVIIPHLNQPEHLDHCLVSLENGQRRPDEIVIVDNGSNSLPGDLCARHDYVTLLQEATPGPGPARNLGVSATTGDILAFIDADCTASPQWLAAAEREMLNANAQILGGDVRIGLVDPEHPTPLEVYESEYAYRMDRYIAREGFTGTGNLVVRRSVMEDVGPFGGLEIAEDRDWGQRATAKGYRIQYVAEMCIYHPARTNLDEIFRKWDRQTAHDYVAASKKTGGLARFALKTAAMGLSPLAEIPRILRSDRIPANGSRLRGWQTLAQIRLYRTRKMMELIGKGDPERLSSSWNRQ